MRVENLKQKIAIIITINNRYKETKKCLINLNKQIQIYDRFEVDVYLSDSSETNLKFSMNNINFNLKYQKIGYDIYWNLGMNESWKTASMAYKYDFYLWLNNDTYLFNNGLKIFFDDYRKIDSKSILVGITEHNDEITYGGREKLDGPITKPNGYPQQIKIMNGNCVLIPNSSFKKLGFLDKKFTHSLGDIDYGLRSIKNNIPLYCTSSIVANCKTNNFKWYDSELLNKRYKNLISPKGVPLFEYFYFNNKHFGILRGLKFILATLTALFFPRVYKNISNK